MRTPARQLVVPNQIVASQQLIIRLGHAGNHICLRVVKHILSRLSIFPLLSVSHCNLAKVRCDLEDRLVLRIREFGVVGGTAKVLQSLCLGKLIELAICQRKERHHRKKSREMHDLLKLSEAGKMQEISGDFLSAWTKTIERAIESGLTESIYPLRDGQKSGADTPMLSSNILQLVCFRQRTRPKVERDTTGTANFRRTVMYLNCLDMLYVQLVSYKQCWTTPLLTGNI